MKSRIHQQRAGMQITGIVIVSVLLLGLFGMLLPVLPSSSMMRDSFWVHKADAEPVYDVVFVGDSRVYRGIDPEVFGPACKPGISAFNYGFSSAGLDSFLIGRAVRLLDKNGERILVIGVSANSFLPESVQNQHLRSVLKWSDKDRWIKREIYPYLRCFDAYKISDLYRAAKGEGYLETYHLASGFAESDKVPRDSGAALEAYRKQFSLEQYDTVAEMRFINYIEQLRDHGVNIKLVRIPAAFAMKKLEDHFTNNRLDMLRKTLSRKGFVWLEPKGNYISYDGSHLEASSANSLSEELAGMICKNRGNTQ